MNRLLKQFLLVFGILAFGPMSLSAAESVQLIFEFTKKPPVVGVVYAVENLPAEKNDEIDQQQKRFTKPLLITDNGGVITFKNNDAVEHNIFARDTGADVLFDVGLMPVGSEKEMPVQWQPDSLVRIGCKIHPRMRSYIANFNSATYKVIEFDRTQRQFATQLDGVRQAQVTYKLLMPQYDPITVDLKKGESKRVALVRKGKERGHVIFNRK